MFDFDMKALTYTAYGMESNNLLVQEVDTRERMRGQLLLKVQAASLNPVDYKMLLGNYKQWAKVVFPAILGHDVVGMVEECDKDSSFRKGQLVYGCMAAGFPGSFASHCVINENCVSTVPEDYSYLEAACLPLVGMTCLQAFDNLAIGKGTKVLIHAGSGGVGSMAIQLAKNLGAYVYTTTSSKNEDWVKGLGADEVICYDKEDYGDRCRDLDAVFDTLGGEHTFKSMDVLRRGGALVNIAGRPDHTTAKQLGLARWIRTFLWLKSRKVFSYARKRAIRYSYVLMQSNTADLDRLKQMLGGSEIRPIIDKTYSLDEGVDAMLYLYSQRVKGKLVFDLLNRSTF